MSDALAVPPSPALGGPASPLLTSAARWSRLAVAITVVAAVALPTVVERHSTAVLAAGFLLGLPHGGVDHLVPFWTGRLRRRPRALLVVLAAYAGLAVATVALLRTAGAGVLVALLVVSVLHFGFGDLMADPPVQAGDPARRAVRTARLVAAALARGGPVVAGPLLVAPTETARLLAAVQPGFPPVPAAVRLAVVGLVAACALLTVLWEARARRLGAVADVVLLNALFVLTPPLAAFGVYFGAWHAMRHTARLVSTDPHNGGDLRSGRLAPPLRRFAAAAWLPSLVALGAVAVLVAVAAQQDRLVGPVFATLLALTVPHLVVVAGLDLASLRAAR